MVILRVFLLLSILFTGIIESLGKVVGIKQQKTNLVFEINSTITDKLKIDQSIAHNGVCLTVVDLKQSTYQVVLINETLKKSNLGKIKIGDELNLERAMLATDRFDGHIVQGHVDQRAICKKITNLNGSNKFRFKLSNKKYTSYLINQGSITINGVSLTTSLVAKDYFEVCIIPYTMNHTNFKNLKQEDSVNIEFDLLGKYVKKMLPNFGKKL